jgi:LacI family transcriptional regulator
LTEDDREIEARQIRELVGARAAGIILVPTARPKREAKAMLDGIAHVQFLRRLPNLGDVWFGIDDAAGLKAATEHLLSRGHSRIGYIGGTAQLSTGAARASGYRTALTRAKIKRVATLEHLGEPTAAFGESAAAQLLHLARPPTAILTGSAHITLGVIRTLERTGTDTPGQLSVVGFGDAPWYEWWRGGLTTIRPPVKDLATNCGLWFLNNLRTSVRGSLDPYSSSTNSLLIQRKSVGNCPS